MTALDSTQLGYLRNNHPHKASFALTVIVPPTVYCGTITGSPDRGAREITVVNQSGNIANVLPGQTVYIGTSCGAQDIGKRRLRSRDGQVLTLDESPLIWKDGWHLTVVENWELWSVFPYIEGEGGKYAFYKDFDVAYTDENDEPPPVAIAGAHKVGYMSGASITFDLDGSDSYAVAFGASVTGYAWECTGGNIANAAIATTTINFVAAGTYWLKLTVTDDNGKTQSTRRVIRVHDVNDPPYYDFSTERALSGSWDNGGWDTSFSVRCDAGQAVYPDGALVILWADQFYDTVEVSIGVNDNALFIGYISRESIEKDLDTGVVKFSAATIHEAMKNSNMYSVSLSAIDDIPTTWNEYIIEMTVARAMHHYWRYHSTLFDIADVILPMTNVLRLYAQDFGEGSLYSVIDEFGYQHSIFVHVCSTKTGKIYVEKDIQMQSIADRAAATVTLEITEADRKTELEIKRSPQFRNHLITLSGLRDNDNVPLLSQAPGVVPEPSGYGTASFDMQLLDDQDEANYLSGRLWGIMNREIEEVRIPFAGNYHGVFDLVPQEWSKLSLTADETKRGFVWIEQKLVPRNITTDINIAQGSLSTNVVLEPEAESYDGVTMEYPTLQPFTWSWPPFPNLPPWSFPGWNIPNWFEGGVMRNVYNGYSTFLYPIVDSRMINSGINLSDSPTVTNLGIYHFNFNPPVSSENYVFIMDWDGGHPDEPVVVYRVDYTGARTAIQITEDSDGTWWTQLPATPLISDDIIFAAAFYDTGSPHTMVLKCVNFATGTVTDVLTIDVGTNYRYEFMNNLIVAESAGDFVIVLPIVQSDASGKPIQVHYHMYNYTQSINMGKITSSIRPGPCTFWGVMAALMLTPNKIIFEFDTRADDGGGFIDRTIFHYLDIAAWRVIATFDENNLSYVRYAAIDYEQKSIGFSLAVRPAASYTYGYKFHNILGGFGSFVDGDSEVPEILSDGVHVFKCVDGIVRGISVGISQFTIDIGVHSVSGDDFKINGDNLCAAIDQLTSEVWRFDSGNLIGKRLLDGVTRSIPTGITDLHPLDWRNKMFLFLQGDRMFILAYDYNNQMTLYLVRD